MCNKHYLLEIIKNIGKDGVLTGKGILDLLLLIIIFISDILFDKLKIMEKLGKQNEKPQQQENIRLSEAIEYNDFIKALINSFEMKEKVSENFERKIEQGGKNDTFYIFAKGSEFKLVKDGKETFIPLSDDSVIGETTLLQYLDGKETKATASVEIKGEYYEVSFKEFKNKFNNLSDKEKKPLISFLKELENKRKGKTKVVEK